MIKSAIIYENERIVVIATGINGNKREMSANPKTGAMVQTWILAKQLSPLDLVRTKSDSLICGDCPLKDGGLGKRGCYVTVFRAPNNVWKAYQRGNYPTLTIEEMKEVFAGKYVRFGSYGEPTLIPFPIIEAIAKVSANFTGYCHSWKKEIYQGYKQYLMASTTPSDYLDAQAMGWRTFTMSNVKLQNQTTCPASKESGYRTTCQECGLCKGNSIVARSIQIAPHGIGKYTARKMAV